MTQRPYRIGIDLGGTKIEGIVLAPDHREIYRKRIPTCQQEGYEAILKRIAALYRTLKSKITPHAHTLGIGTPGALSEKTRRLKNSNTQCLNGQFLKEDLTRGLGRPFVLENDANCFALAEALLGAGRAKKVVFGVIMGTGCGGGLVYGRRVWRGLQAIAGEWGHMAIDPRGPVCYCGARGCVETLISGGGLEKRFLKEFKRRASVKDIILMSQAGNTRAVYFLRRFYRDFGRSLANLINVLDPEIIVLGGGLSNMDALYQEGVAQVRKHVFSDDLNTPIVRHQLGDSAGVLGAAMVGV